MRLILILLTFLLPALLLSQETYKIGSTEYYYNQTYSNGKPKVKRSEVNKSEFLRSQGHTSTPYGYEIDHIIPLSEGGTDDPSNMQLLTIEEHKRKTARERASNTNSTYSNYSSLYNSNSTFDNSDYEYSNGKKIYTGKNGGKYYYNSNGNKTYIKANKSNSTIENYPDSSSSSSSATSTCGARTKSGSYCKRKVKGGGRCYQH